MEGGFSDIERATLPFFCSDINSILRFLNSMGFAFQLTAFASRDFLLLLKQCWILLTLSSSAISDGGSSKP